MKKNLIYLLSAILLMSCNTNSKKSLETNNEINIINLSNLASVADQFDNEEVSISGLVTHVCRHGGQKMFLTDSLNTTNIKVVVTESIPEFDIALEGSYVEVVGKLVISQIESEVEKEGKNIEHGDEGDCATETEMAEQTEDCKSNITYHIEANSFKEITDK